MSADPSFEHATKDFIKGGWIVSILGIAGGLVDLMLSEKDHSWAFWIKRSVAGGLTGVIMYFALHPVNMDPLYKSVLMCISGAVAPELLKKAREKINGHKESKRRKRK